MKKPAGTMERALTVALPKGSLQEATFALFKKAGYNVVLDRRSFFPYINDPELKGRMLRAQEIARYVQSGDLDCGLTGLDWVLENNAKVHEVADIRYAKSSFTTVRWVLAVPEDSPITRIEQLEGKRVCTELLQYTKRYFKKRKVKANIEFSWGATEAKVPDLADAIVELTETGSSLRANKLRIVETLLESSTRLIANTDSWNDPWKRKKIEDLALMLLGALNAEGKVGLKMNLPRAALDDVVRTLPSMKNPTVSPLSDTSWVAIEIIVSEKTAREIIPSLRRAGACDIIEYSLTKVIA
jgi:ATP phosphoribosyltransferase